MVEYLVGDGPNNRYALICCKCHSHNGMCLRDEFEYMTFRCAYCYHMNPAHKSKPNLRNTTNKQCDTATTKVRIINLLIYYNNYTVHIGGHYIGYALCNATPIGGWRQKGSLLVVTKGHEDGLMELVMLHLATVRSEVQV